MTMSTLEEQLKDYWITFPQTKDTDEEKSLCEIDLEHIESLLKCEEHWKFFLDQNFEPSLLKRSFSSISKENRVSLFKFGIACLLGFVRCNFTGPDLDKDTQDYLNGDKFKAIQFDRLLSVNNEDVNVNTKFPVLLATAKIVFEWCIVRFFINNWWYWRSIIIHQQILDDLSPTLLLEADDSFKLFEDELNLPISGVVLASLYIEIAQLYLLFRNVSKAKEHILSASEKLGVQYDLVGVLGKRTKYQETDVAQLFLKVTIQQKNELNRSEIETSDVPANLPLNDDVRLNSIEYSEDVGEKVSICNVEQKLFLTIAQEMMIATPRNELQSEELEPFLDMILSQKNTYSVRVMALLMRFKLESKNRRTVERSLGQGEEIINSWKKEKPNYLSRVLDVFSTGLPPMWKIESQYADLLLNVGLVKNALDIYTRVKLWEEVIICYTILKLRHKATEIIQEQLKEKPTVKLWCLLGDATDDVTCYEKAWEMSKRRSHRAQRHWGYYLFAHKKYAQCIPHFEKSVSINPLQAQVWSRLGYAALQVENWQTAATAYRRYTTLEPDGFEAWNNLAQAYIKIGNKRNAHQAILEALKCNFENWKVWENLLVVSCDISNFSDVIRAYHSLLDLKERYLNMEVLSVLVYSVCTDVNDCEGQPSQRFLQKTRELLGRITSIYTSEGYVWELYASVAPAMLLRAQRLQRAYRGYTQGSWDKNPSVCQQVLYVCGKLAEIVLDNEVDPKDTLINSIRLNLKSALTAVKKQDWEETRELVEQVSGQLEKIVQKIKNNNGSDDKTTV